MTPLPGRECGECTACCQYMTIDAPELQKYAGAKCPNCIAKQGCAIYDTRPSVCRTFHCAWRVMPWLDDKWRPDRSGVLLAVIDSDIPPGYGDFGIAIELIGGFRVLLTTDFANLVAHLMGSRMATFLRVPPMRPGWAGSKTFLNEILAPVVATHDLPAVQQSLLDALEAGVRAPKQRLILRHAKRVEGEEPGVG